MISLLLVAGIGFTLMNKTYMSDFPCVRMVADRDITREFSVGWYDILDEIKYSKEDDVTIEADEALLYLDLDPLVKSPGVGEHTDYGANIHVARYYGKNTVKVILKEQAGIK
ncbi:MAG: hypothetical protein K6G03_10125 [Lachnospiraceae bacterium]|nr:hypothetical protein [Lachnospiraceae bacterium]